MVDFLAMNIPRSTPFAAFVACAASLLAMPITGVCGPATLFDKEIPALQALVSSDMRAGGQFNKLRELAEASMTDEPSPIRTVISEGRLQTDPDKIRTNAAMKDMPKLEALAWTSILADDARYAAQARRYLLAWARTNVSDGNPINETRFEPLVEAYDLLRNDLSRADQVIIDEWLRDKARALLVYPKGHKENWQSHRIKMVGLIAATIGDDRLWNTSLILYRQHILNNFDASGSSVDFSRRDSLHYHLYSVQPLLSYACAAGRRNSPVFAYTASNDASLEKAVDFLVPYAVGEQTHTEFANSQVRFDRKRAASGEGEYAVRKWNPKQSIALFAEASCVSDRYQKHLDQVAPQIKGGYANWRAVINRTIRLSQESR